MTNEELIGFHWEGISFAEQNSRKIIIFICSNIESAENFLKAIRTIEFDLGIVIKEQTKTFSFHLGFKTGEIMKFDTIYTEDNYPQVKWAKHQQLTHITTGYRNSQNNLQLSLPAQLQFGPG